jgi:hypothetical protein
LPIKRYRVSTDQGVHARCVARVPGAPPHVFPLTGDIRWSWWNPAGPSRVNVYLLLHECQQGGGSRRGVENTPDGDHSLDMHHPAAGAPRRCPVQRSSPLGPDQVNVLLLLDHSWSENTVINKHTRDSNVLFKCCCGRASDVDAPCCVSGLMFISEHKNETRYLYPERPLDTVIATINLSSHPPVNRDADFVAFHSEK